MHQFPIDPLKPVGCKDCAFLPDCGGNDDERYEDGCFQRCLTRCVSFGCDLACPVSSLMFGDYLDDVGGLGSKPKLPFQNLGEKQFPLYIPQIDHGSSRKRHLNVPWISVPLHRIFSRNDRGKPRFRYRNSEELRKAFKVAQGTKIIITCVSPDKCIEDYWAKHITSNFAQCIGELGAVAVTAPNYSFMSDVPRTNSLYNLSRMSRVADSFTQAGVPVVPHINASTKHDWSWWAEVYSDQKQLQTVCIEYQTGLGRSRQKGDIFFRNLVNFQETVGRSIHPIVLGGTSRIAQFKMFFEAFTMIDAIPFSKARQRQVYVYNGRRWNWRKWQSDSTAIDSLLEANIRNHQATQLRRIGLDEKGNPLQEYLLPAA